MLHTRSSVPPDVGTCIIKAQKLARLVVERENISVGLVE